MKVEHAAINYNKTLLLAAATLGACLLPFCDYGGMSVSLVGIYGVIAQAQQAVSGLADVGVNLGDGTTGPANGFNVMTAGLDILLLLYLVPISAATVIYFELTGAPGRRCSRLSGVASIILPILLPYIAWELFKASLPDDVTSLIGSADVGSMGLTPDIGLWTILLLGAVQTYLSFRRGTNPAATLKA